MQVWRPAVATPQASVGVSPKAFFEEQLKQSPVVLVPKTYEFSGDATKQQGELAEKALCDMMEKCGRDIPGIEIISFHGDRVIGGSPPDTIVREVDQCSFIKYQGRHYVIINEVKCNADIKSSGRTRKKAINQLKTFTEMLASELKIETEKLQVHAVWPFMNPTEPCESCISGSHPSLYEKPEACQQPGTQKRTNPETQGFHIFNDKFHNDEFSNWIRSIVSECKRSSSFAAACNMR